MVARCVRKRALKAHPPFERLNGAHEPPGGSQPLRPRTRQRNQLPRRLSGLDAVFYQKSSHGIVRPGLDQLNGRRPRQWPARNRACEFHVGISIWFLREVILQDREYGNRRNDRCDKYAYRTYVTTLSHWCRSERRAGAVSASFQNSEGSLILSGCA
jgi:hypothetical protein